MRVLFIERNGYQHNGKFIGIYDIDYVPQQKSIIKLGDGIYYTYSVNIPYKDDDDFKNIDVIAFMTSASEIDMEGITQIHFNGNYDTYRNVISKVKSFLRKDKISNLDII